MRENKGWNKISLKDFRNKEEDKVSRNFEIGTSRIIKS